MNPIILFKFFVQKKRIADSKKENELHSRHFCEYRKNYFKFSDKAYSNFEELKSNPPEADAYIVGSDQVWNFGKGNLRIFKNVIHSFIHISLILESLKQNEFHMLPVGGAK